MKIALMKGISQYDAMRNYIDQWEQCCKEFGHDTSIYDAAEQPSAAQLQSWLQERRPELLLCCNAIGADFIEQIMPDGCRYATVLYDNPVVHSARLAGLGERSVVFSCDQFYADFIRENYPHIRQVGFLPLSGNVADVCRPYQKRQIPVLFTGSYFDLKASAALLQKLPHAVQLLAENMIDIMLQEPDMLLWQALDQVLSDNDLFFEPDVRLQILNGLGCVDLFVRSYVRDVVMRQVVRAGVSVHIFGNGWERFHAPHSDRLVIHSGYGETALKALANARISLNVMPWFRGGLQERNIAAMLSGAVSFTDSSRYLEQHFTDNEDLKYYSLKQPEEIPYMIQALLEQEEWAEQIAERGRQKAQAGHTWRHRVKEMLRCIEETA